jgi:hypothetical protein
MINSGRKRKIKYKAVHPGRVHSIQSIVDSLLALRSGLRLGAHVVVVRIDEWALDQRAADERAPAPAPAARDDAAARRGLRRAVPVLGLSGGGATREAYTSMSEWPDLQGPNPEDVLHAEEVEPEPDLDVEPLTAPTLVRPFAMAPSTSLRDQRKHC